VILVDTSVWVAHLRSHDKMLASLLDAASVLVHPFVIGELSLGSLRQRDVVLSLLLELPKVSVAADHEFLRFVGHNRLFWIGIGYVDAHLLAAVRLTPGSSLWTHDKRLARVADKFGVGAELPG
jgi:predicted nucleic acid-binding protein